MSLEEKIKQMKSNLKNGGATVAVAPTLYPTPEWLADQMVNVAFNFKAKFKYVLEPSAGTGDILHALIRRGINPVNTQAVEINYNLCDVLRKQRFKLQESVMCADFLDLEIDSIETVDTILMNPPFNDAQDIKHIEHAIGFLNKGGVLVAICANGPRQVKTLKPRSSYWEELPAGSFKQAGTNVNTTLLVIKKDW